MDLLSSYNEQINSILEPLTQPPISYFLTLFLVMYGKFAAPQLPATVANLFTKLWFRVIILAMIIWTGNRDPSLAIMVAVVFVVTFHLLSNNKYFETFEGPEEGPQTSIYPGCQNLTVYDLLESFNNDKNALLSAMLVSKIPGNIKITDSYAPLIGTYLLNKGFPLKAPCTPPGVEQKIGAWI